MIKTCFLYWTIIFVLANSSCTIELGQPAAETPHSPSNALPTTQIQVTWAGLNLTGKLVYNMGAIEDDNYIVRVLILDLVTGKLDTLYTAPINAWVYYVSASADGKQLIMSYSPPPQENLDVAQALYIMPLDGSKPPQLLFTPPTRADQYTQAEWSPDGKYIYYTQVNYEIPNDPNRIYPLYNIFRMAYPAGQPESITEGAYWPRLSLNSSRLVYVSVDPLSVQHQLKIADSDGGNVQEVILSGSYIPDIKDAPIFSPDGKSIIFSAPIPQQTYPPSWHEKLIGVLVAKANGGLPADWWSVPVTGGALTRLTYIQASSLYASLSPDGKHLVSFSGAGIFVMNPDGSELTIVVPNLDGFTGTVSWIP
jgi:Tol biopolymer transport system component